jgi:hypothetical protein
MPKQMSLRLVTSAELLTLWDELPQKHRSEAIEMYANLIARVAQFETPPLQSLPPEQPINKRIITLQFHDYEVVAVDTETPPRKEHCDE